MISASHNTSNAPQLDEKGRKLELINENDTNERMPRIKIYRAWSSKNILIAWVAMYRKIVINEHEKMWMTDFFVIFATINFRRFQFSLLSVFTCDQFSLATNSFCDQFSEFNFRAINFPAINFRDTLSTDFPSHFFRLIPKNFMTKPWRLALQRWFLEKVMEEKFQKKIKVLLL